MPEPGARYGNEQGTPGTVTRNGEKQPSRRDTDDSRIRAKLPILTPYFYRKFPIRPPVQGCAYTGALMVATQVTDAVTISHGPRSCAHMNRHYLYSGAHRALTRYRVALPEKLDPALVSTDLDENAMVHGGGERLTETLRQVLTGRPPAAFVVTTCPAGLIGDELAGAIARAQPVSPETRVIPMEVDGNLTGGYSEGWLEACRRIATDLIDPARRPEDDAVNLIGESNYGHTEHNYRRMEELLGALDVRVNTRFIQRATVSSLQGFCRGGFNLLAHGGFANRRLADFLTERFGAVFAEETLPIGFDKTRRWLREIAGYFGRAKTIESATERVIAGLEREYRAGVDGMRDSLRGKRLMLLVSYETDVDWILETAFDCGMEVVRLAVMRLDGESDPRTRYADRVDTCFGYRPEQQIADIRQLKPDLLVSSFTRQGLPPLTRYDTFPTVPVVGPQANLELARRWRRLLRAPLEEGWKRDGRMMAGAVSQG